MKHDAALEKVFNRAFKDQNVLGLLLIGSMANMTHTKKSDIDLLVVYKNSKRDFGLKNRRIRGVKVQKIFFTYDTLLQSLEKVPYLLHIFCDAVILLDREESISPIVENIKAYFGGHPQIAEEWQQKYAEYKIQKTKSICEQTSILQIWDDFEDRYSGGQRIRPFFNLPVLS